MENGRVTFSDHPCSSADTPVSYGNSIKAKKRDSTLGSSWEKTNPPRNFSSAKKIASRIYSDNQSTFYCGCEYHKVNGKLRVDLASCGYQVRKQPKRAGRVEWEHVVPAWWLGHQRQCWQNGGRKNCRKSDPVFRQAEADLHNLVPSVGEVNGDRSNYRFGMVTSSRHATYGDCPVKIDFKQRVAEPPANVRGDIARIYFYMSDSYGIRLSKQQKRLFDVWNSQDPESEWEREKNKRIKTGSSRSTDFVVHQEKITVGRAGQNGSMECGKKRTCGEMNSCKEARWFLNNCGLSRLDRDRDGMPCESLCR